MTSIMNIIKRKPRKRDEGTLQLQILKLLNVIGAVAGKTKTMGVRRGDSYCIDKYNFAGFADITFFYNNRLYFCEVKSPAGVQSEEQRAFQELCQEAGITYILARSLDDVSKAIGTEVNNVSNY